jgi:flagellar hook-basal body complex protein FliE
MSTNDGIEKESKDTKGIQEEQGSTSKAKISQDDEKKVVVVTPAHETEHKNSEGPYSDSDDDNEEKHHQSVSTKAKEAGQSLKEIVKSLGKKTKLATGQAAQQIKDKADVGSDIDNKKDSRYIQALGENVEKVVTVFEDTMTEISNERDYDEQENLLIGYKKLLEEQINVINSKLKMVKRLKNIA